MNFFKKYLGDTFELVETLKESEQDFVAVVYDKHTKKVCVMKQRALNSRPIYQMLKELDEPHIPKIYRLFDFDGKLIVVEEFIDGKTLEEILIYQPELLGEKFAANILLSLCECLYAIHAKNIVHRDIKPSNIMLTDFKEVKLIDFGIARLFKPDSRADTELLGTRGYAPPEQFGLFGAGQTDSRSDIYSLGVTIKNLLGEDYNGKLSDILNRCTSLEPLQRFQSAAELRNAVLRRQKFYHVKKFLVAALICPAIIFIPNVAEENFQSPEVELSPEIFSEIQPPVVDEEKIVESPPPDNSDNEIFNRLTNFVINPPTVTPTLPEIPSTPQTVTPAPPVEKPAGEVEFKFYLNGELTDKYHMVYLRDWHSWQKNSYGEYLFPPSMTSRLRIENHSGKDLINPRVDVEFGYDEYTLEYPTIANGQTADINIPLGGQLAAPVDGSGNLLVTLKPEGEPEIFFNKTFFLVK